MMFPYIESDGIDITEYVINYSGDEQLEDEFKNLKVEVSSGVTEVLDIEIGTTFLIARGSTEATRSTEQVLFRGYITQVSKSAFSITLICRDKLWDTTRREYTHDFDIVTDPEGGKISEIMKTIVTQAGLSYSATSIQDSGDVYLIDKFTLVHSKIYDAMKRLKKLLGWQLYYNSATDKIHFEPLGFTIYPYVFKLGSPIISTPRWEYNFENVVNHVEIIGAETLYDTIQTFSGDGSTKNFQLNYIPRITKVYLSDVLKTGGVTDSTTTYDYTIDASYDQRYVKFVTAPPVGSGNIRVEYSYPVPQKVDDENAESIAKYGEFTRSYKMDDIKSVEDAILKAKSIIEEHGEPYVTAKNVKIVGVYDLNIGNKIHIIDEINNENRVVAVQRITFDYPKGMDELEVGDKIWREPEVSVDTREELERLKKEMAGIQNEMTTTIKHFDEEFIYESRYAKFTTQGYDTSAGDNSLFVLGHSRWGILGTNKLGGSNTAEVLVNLIHPNQTYHELFYDNDFIDTTNSTATLDTTNKKLKWA